MGKLFNKCDTDTIALTVFNSVLNVGTSNRTYSHVEGDAPVRVGPVATPFMLHVTTNSEDIKCPLLFIERIVECPNGCDMDEFRYAFPCECGSSYLLPAGTYDITVCKQEVAPLQAGDVLEITFMVEPVNDSFAMIYLSKV